MAPFNTTVRPSSAKVAGRRGHRSIALRGANHVVQDALWVGHESKMVARDGIEPPTRGFSIPCSTD